MAEPSYEDDTNPSSNEEDDKQTLELSVPVNSGVLKMVHSPTSDTLDSVILENLTTDDCKSEESNAAEEIKLDTSETEDPENPENNSDLSKYFDAKDSDAFTSISGAGTDFFDNIPSSGLISSETLLSNPDNNTADTEELATEITTTIVGSNPLSEESNSNTNGGLVHQQQFTLVEEEGETVEFEGEHRIPSESEIPVTEMDEDDNFESFTADNSEMSGPNMPPIDNRTTEIPSIPATPSQLSPLTTPVHQSTIDPLVTFNQTFLSGLERQTSQTVEQTSNEQHVVGQTPPFHHFQKPSMPFDNIGDSNPIEDPFTASLFLSDSDRRHDAWIPSDATRHILMSMAASVPGTYFPAVEQLCSPCLLITESQGDPVRDLVFRYMGEQEAVKRQVLTVDSVTKDEKGLAALVAAGCLRAAVDLTGDLLTDEGQGQSETGKIIQHSPKTLQLWFCRFAMLMRLKLFELIDLEMKAFNALDSPDFYFEFYPRMYTGRRGSMVSFGLRIIHAELPHFLGRHQESMDKLYYVLAVTSKIIKNLEAGLSEDGACIDLSPESLSSSLVLWCNREKQVQYKIASVLLSMKDYEAAICIYEMLAEKECENRKCLLSGIGRIYLQMGNVTKASQVFKQVESESSDGKNIAMNSINKGFLAMCANKFLEAYEHFKSAVQLEPNNTSAVNNMAVCSLYMCRLKDALNTLESLVHKDPSQNLHEGILFNLCTLYELESSRALHKKQAVLDMVRKYKGDGFPVNSLKMS